MASRSMRGLAVLGLVAAAMAPALAQADCGYIYENTESFRDKGIYPAQVLLIDGETPTQWETGYKITPGQHTVKVGELIPEGELGITGMPNSQDMHKTVTMNFDAGKAYVMASKVATDATGGSAADLKDYWDITMFVIAKPCK